MPANKEAQEFVDAIRSFHDKTGDGKYFAEMLTMEDARSLAEGMRKKFAELLGVEPINAWDYVYQSNTRVYYNLDDIVVPEESVKALEMELTDCEVEEHIEDNLL